MVVRQPAIFLAACILFAALASGVLAEDVTGSRAKVVFAVHCYDVGKSVLEGMDGVISVERGWSGFDEINTVVYDPEKITVEEMVNALKRANTYKETISTE